jgi:hypothetical protein
MSRLNSSFSGAAAAQADVISTRAKKRTATVDGGMIEKQIRAV